MIKDNEAKKRSINSGEDEREMLQATTVQWLEPNQNQISNH